MRQRGAGATGGGGQLPLYQDDVTTHHQHHATPPSSNSSSHRNTRQRRRGGNGDQQQQQQQHSRSSSWEITSSDSEDIESGRRRRRVRGRDQSGEGLYVEPGGLLASDNDEGEYDELDLNSDSESQRRQQHLFHPAQPPPQQARNTPTTIPSTTPFHSLHNWQQQQKYQQQYQNSQYPTTASVPPSPSSSSSLLIRRMHYENTLLKQQFQHPSLQDFHTVYRRPLHVPDKDYHDFLLAEPRQRGYLGYRKKQQAPIVTQPCCAFTCGGFSAVASIFLVFVGILLDTQPLLIKGALPQQVTYSSQGSSSGSSRPITRYLVPRAGQDERLPSAHAAYQASLAYFFLVFVCWYLADPTWLNAKLYRLRNKYQDIPDTPLSTVSSNLPTFHAHDGQNGGAAADNNMDDTRSNQERAGGVITAAYQQGFLGGGAYLWGRFTNFGRQWLASRGWYSSARRRRKYRSGERRDE